MEKGFIVEFPPVFKNDYAKLGLNIKVDDLINLSPENEVIIKKDLPLSFKKDVISFTATDKVNEDLKRKINVAVVFSGGPAPGGHNIVCGAYEVIKKLNPESKLYGCLDGFEGLLNGKFMEITQKEYDNYLNTGGFDMMGSARVKITKDKQVDECIEHLTKHDINALMIIGGDDSNTNAAILAEKFLEKKSPINVIGIPKTIDGDLKNKYIEQSFGFDTATAIYSYQIGNICRDAKSSRKYWHFIKLMGRDTGHICLECALKTHPNIAVIGEEGKKNNCTLKLIAHHICDGIIERSNKNENFGVVIFSEGIVESCSETYKLLVDIDTIKKANLKEFEGLDKGQKREQFVSEKLKETYPDSYNLFEEVPIKIRSQFLLDRDAHGHFQCARIDSDQLLIHLVEKELEERKFKKFNSQHHSFGYEGRCG